MKINYQEKLDSIIEDNQSKKVIPKLLLHCCCGPCSSYCLEYLNKFFDITLLYYNPNISPVEEYNTRYEELKKLLTLNGMAKDIKIMETRYNYKEFENIAKGLEEEPEGGERCTKCYYLRLEEAAKMAALNNFDYFTTTLSISPYKDADRLNRIGEVLQNKYHVKYLYADFKKKNGYKRSIELSKQYGLYRQDYCGCIYSKQERDRKDKLNEGKENK